MDNTLKCKIFCNNTTNQLQNEINEWIEKPPRKVVKLFQQSESVDECGWSITITIFYTYELTEELNAK